MASNSRETSIIQQFTVTGGARLPAGYPAINKGNVSYYDIPNRRVVGFVGREDILQKIDKALSDGSGPRYAVLQGMGGQGKSQVALEYCDRKKDHPYSAIFWVDATTQSSVEGSFQSISERLKEQTDYLPDINARVAFVLKMFTSWTVQWLMVFDNYNPYTSPNIRDFIPQSELGAILVTSRQPGSLALVNSQSNRFIELSGLEKDDAVALLIQQSQTNEVNYLDAEKIVERLGRHPLAITQAGAYIRIRKLRLCEFMDHYKRRKKRILKITSQLSQYRNMQGNAEVETSLNIFTILELLFQQLQFEASENGVEAKLLTLLAFFDENDISEQLFAGFSASQEQRLESAKLLTWLKAFSSARGQWDSNSFEIVLLGLRDSSLLTVFTHESDGFIHAYLHPLVKDWIRLRTNKSISQENTYMAATLVTDILSNSWQKQHFDLPLVTKKNILSHIIALEKSYKEFFISQPYIPSTQKIFDEYTTSQCWFARFLSSTGSYHLAAVITQRLNAQNEKVLGLEHPSTLTSMADLASIYRNQGRLKDAEELETQVMETRKRVLGLEHPCTLTIMANLASTYRNQGRLREAEELDVQVMETSSRVLGLEHPDTLSSMANLASTYRNQGRWKEAEKLDVEVVEKSSRVLGLEHPSTQTSIANLASTYRDQDRWKEAEELGVQVMETSSKVLGLEHLDTYRISALTQPPLTENPSTYSGSTLVVSANLMPIERVANQVSNDSGSKIKCTEQLDELESDSIKLQDVVQSTESIQDPDLDEIKTLISDDEDLSSQISSDESSERAIAERQLGALMANHPELDIAYDEAMALIPEDRFVANFCRLLKRFYLDIRPIASTSLERTAVELLRSRGARMRLARIISDARNASGEENDAQTEGRVRRAHQKDRTEMERWTKSIASGEPYEAENTATDSGSNDSGSDDKGESSEQFPNIQLVEDFLTGSAAFHALSHNFGIFVLPRSLSQLALSIPPSQIRFSNDNDVSLINKIKSFMEEHTGAQWNWWPLSPRKQFLGPKQTRMHWQCFCKKHLWTEMSTSQSSIFRKLSENMIAQSTRIPLCSKMRKKKGFLTFVPRWAPNPNSTSSNSQQSIPLGISTPPSALSGLLSAMSGPRSRLPPSSLTSPNIVANNPRTIVSSNLRVYNRLWTLFGVHGGRKTLELGQICSNNSGDGFLSKLRETYRDLRGFRRFWFSCWQFSHCDFVKFEKIGTNRITSRCTDLPTGLEYEYYPRPPQADIPPITPHEFKLAFSSCDRNCLFAMFHDCIELDDEEDFVVRIPKKKGKFEMEKSNRKGEGRFAWGIEAQYAISFLHVIMYHLLMMVGPTVFWVWWQKKHPNDLQNASIPLAIAAILISLFWSATGILRGLREPRSG
ncbi:hypothetical protein MMC31_005897 [Peltigera leucophlebia]|nr:hypothetical protein [Peltigera leucophlebia]